MASIDLLKIRGGKPLQGKITAQGAKNLTSKILVASLISDQKSIFYNVPDIVETEITLHLCREIGSEFTWDKSNKTIEIETKEIKTAYIPQKYSGANRIPILLLGALLGRSPQDVIVPTVGGDNLGSRPVDFHISALETLGANIEYREMQKEGAYFGQAHHGLHGGLISLPYPSVGATENALLAACRAKGSTTIINAAIEPEIIDLILYLQKIGVDISFLSDRTIRIESCERFLPTEHYIQPDRNEIISYALAAIGTKGEVFIENADQKDLISFLSYLRKIGAGFRVEKNGMHFFYEKELQGNFHLETDVHPGFMTDWQQPFVVLLTQVNGRSVIHETVYENRFGYVKTLNEMGANIVSYTHCLGNHCRFAHKNHHHSIVVEGATPLLSKKITIPDLRAGFAYVMAALIAKEESTIANVHYLDRGYEDLVGKLSHLQADIKRISLTKEREKATV